MDELIGTGNGMSALVGVVLMHSSHLRQPHTYGTGDVATRIKAHMHRPTTEKAGHTDGETLLNSGWHIKHIGRDARQRVKPGHGPQPACTTVYGSAVAMLWWHGARALL